MPLSQQRRKDAAAKAETLAEEQRLRLLEKERIAEANRIEVLFVITGSAARYPSKFGTVET